MELDLSRVDYTVVGLTSAKCMRLLPSSSGFPQKVVIGDQDGLLQIFSIKKGEIQQIAKIPGTKITRLDLGGTSDGPQDKIFVSCETEIKGFTKKGKLFLSFDTNMTDSVKSMCVQKNHLFVTGEHNFYQYQDLKELNNYYSEGIINDLIVLDSVKVNTLTPILACKNRVLKVLEDSHELYSIPLSSCPTILHSIPGNFASESQVVYGTSEGGVGLLQIGSRELKNSWLLEPDPEKGQITALDSFDLTGDNSRELILGREDGFIEVYKLYKEESPKLLYSYNCNEMVTCLICGIIGSNEGLTEILVSTYSGWIFGLTLENVDKKVNVSIDSSNFKLSQEAKQKIIHLRGEIENLEERIIKEREKYQTAAENIDNALSNVPVIAIHDKFCLHREDASYSLCVEVQTSIDNVLIQSDVPIDLLDVEKNSAVVSFSDCDPGDGNFLLATYRCQLNTTRLDLKIRTIEGHYGNLQAYVTPNIQPKCCQLRSYKIKPLSLHTRIHDFDTKRPFSVLNFKGGFTLGEIHSWIEFCLPEVPVKPPPGDTVVMIFLSTFLDTVLQCTYSKGEAEFKSDNISTISILKDIISKQATKNIKKKQNLDITWQINTESINFTLELLRPKLEHQLDLLRKIKILESMTELDLSKNKFEVVSLTDEYLDIVLNEKGIVEEHKKQPSYLDRLYGMITDLYIDKNKFLGINVKNKISALLKLLEKDNYSYDKLLNFFND